jgi:hypothetical protein
MSTTYNGSKPGYTRSTSFYRSISLPQEAYHSRSTSSFKSVSEKEWSANSVEKDNVSERVFPVEGEAQRQSSPVRPGLEHQESYWQAGPPASIYSAADETVYPEGGLRAWLVVLGSFCGMLASFGFMNTSEPMVPSTLRIMLTWSSWSVPGLPQHQPIERIQSEYYRMDL